MKKNNHTFKYLLDYYLSVVKYPLEDHQLSKGADGKGFDVNNYIDGQNNEYVYVVFNPLNMSTKIGITTNVKDRLAKINTQSGIKNELLLLLELEPDRDERAALIEDALHGFFYNKRTIGEWFNLSIKDIIQIRDIFWFIEGSDIDDNIKKVYEKYKSTILTGVNRKSTKGIQCLH
jgi:hypothetical protein